MSVSLVSFTLLFFPLQHFAFSLCSFRLKLFSALFHAYFWLLEICGELWVCPILATLALWAEPTKPKGT